MRRESKVLKVAIRILAWGALSAPLVALAIGAVRERNPLTILLSVTTLLIMIWAFRLNADLDSKNRALLNSYRRQEFLQGLAKASAHSLENRPFLAEALAGLRRFVPWDADLLIVFASESSGEPIAVSSDRSPAALDRVRDEVCAILEDTSAPRPFVRSGEGVRPLLSPHPRSQVVVALATDEVAYGALVAERDAGLPPFTQEEVLFLSLALAQVGRTVQDDILRRQLLVTNRKLQRQTDHLSEILSISNLLKIHFDAGAILDKVAKGIRESLGFRTVLISLYDRAGGVFERIAQAGLEDSWERIRSQRPPEGEILPCLDRKNALGNCFFVSRAEARTDLRLNVPVGPWPSQEPNDWHPGDGLHVPLVDRDSQLLGVISVDEPRDGKVPTLETLRALEILANQTVAALESAQAHAQVRRQAVMDGLTGLCNHVHFQETLASWRRDHRDAPTPYALLMMDLDGFKAVNDTYGHLAGDAVLRSLAATLTGAIRKEDVAARYGGEEFAVLLPHRTVGQARRIADRIRRAVEKMVVATENPPRLIRITISVGLSCSAGGTEDHQQVLERADAALYEAKRAGKNCVRVFGGASEAGGQA